MRTRVRHGFIGMLESFSLDVGGRNAVRAWSTCIDGGNAWEWPMPARKSRYTGTCYSHLTEIALLSLFMAPSAVPTKANLKQRTLLISLTFTRTKGTFKF